ncbi:MAG: elongation factor P maturation arginine rhamnosyltransferase EarP, partial [Fusobacteriaceae bacterium]
MKIEVKSIDIFCEVIDNFGDIGVVYRLAKELKKKYREKVKIRVILDKTYELSEL